MQEVIVSVGANLGNAKKSVQIAIQKLTSTPKVFNVRYSNIYRTKPDTPIAQPDFFNAIVSFKTHLKPKFLLKFLQSIEKELGKVPKEKNEPRPIDLDIIFFGNHIIDEPDLQVPHPKWKEREFVLRPLQDLGRMREVPGEGVLDIQQLRLETCKK